MPVPVDRVSGDYSMSVSVDGVSGDKYVCISRRGEWRL